MKIVMQAIEQTTPEMIKRVCAAIEQIESISDDEADHAEDHYNELCKTAIQCGYDPVKVTSIVIACMLVKLQEVQP